MNSTIVSSVKAVGKFLFIVGPTGEKMLGIFRVLHQISAGHYFPVEEAIVEYDTDSVVDIFFDSMKWIDDSDIRVKKQHPFILRQIKNGCTMPLKHELNRRFKVGFE
jgi:hypothetical protein